MTLSVFYLPKGTEYTAIMNPGSDTGKTNDKIRINEQLILESIGKANRSVKNQSVDSSSEFV